MKSLSEYCNEDSKMIRYAVIEKAKASLLKDLKSNGIKFKLIKGNTYDIEDSPKASMAVRMVKERFGMQSISVKVNESEDGLITYSIVCRDSEGSLKAMLEHIQTVGNTGHSMTIVVDEDCDDEKRFGWDGDGSDYIKSITVNK